MEKIKVLDDFVDDATCDNMVKTYDRLFQGRNKNYDGRLLLSNPHDPEVNAFLKVYVGKLSSLFNQLYYIRDLLLSIYQVGARVDPHVDFEVKHLKDSMGVLFYFNDDFKGGDLYFTNFEFNYQPKKGSIVIFPCNDPEYKHGVNPVTEGIRYTLPLELTTNKAWTKYDLEVI